MHGWEVTGLILVDLQVKYTASSVTFNVSGSQDIEISGFGLSTLRAAAVSRCIT